MKKGTILILAYVTVVVSVIVLVKNEQAKSVVSKVGQEILLADCGDPPPTTTAGE